MTITRRRACLLVALIALCPLATCSGASDPQGAASTTTTVPGTVTAGPLPTAGEVTGDLPRATLSTGTSAPVVTVPRPTTTLPPCLALTLQGPLFAPGSADLTASAVTVLDELAARLRPTTGTITITGHTDRRPTAGGNLRLSERRAQAVLDALAARQVDPDRMQTVARGDLEPIDPADTAEAYAKNRRVEITVTCA